MNASPSIIAAPSRAPSALTSCVGAAWLLVVLAGAAFMMVYANTPGPAGAAPLDWPGSTIVSPGQENPVLMMFLHPHCPCSTASVEELSRLMARCQGRVEVHVFFLRPARMTPDWVHSDSWQSAALIPGVAVHFDDEGREALRFGAKTSGEVELFDASGHLVFHGGITAARGHAGDNNGLDAVQEFILHQSLLQSNAPVFGCSLFDCRSSGSSTP
jgi:hypothetical protein